MSIANQKEQDPKKSLLVTIELTKTKLKYFNFCLAAIIEYEGVHLEDKIKNIIILLQYFLKNIIMENYFLI